MQNCIFNLFLNHKRIQLKRNEKERRKKRKYCTYKFLAAPNPPGMIRASKLDAFKLSSDLMLPLVIRADSTSTFLIMKRNKELFLYSRMSFCLFWLPNFRLNLACRVIHHMQLFNVGCKEADICFASTQMNNGRCCLDYLRTVVDAAATQNHSHIFCASIVTCRKASCQLLLYN